MTSALEILNGGNGINYIGSKSYNIRQITNEDREKLANLREVYFTRDILNASGILKNDLQQYVDNADIRRMKLIVLDELIPSFLRKICNVYDTPPLYKFPKDADTTRFDMMLDEVQLNRWLPETLERSRFHNTIIAFVRYNKELDKLYIENSWHAGNCEIETYDSYDKDMRKFSYLTGSGDATYRIFWELLSKDDSGKAKTLHYKMKIGKAGKPIDEKLPVGENTDLFGPDYWPFVTYRYSERGEGFWGNAMDSLVELVRAINILLTVIQDDTIQETIRILLLNFDAIGTEGDKGQLKTGLRHPIMPENQLGRDNMDAKIIEAKLYNDEAMKLIEGLWSVVANTHNVGNVLKPDFKQAISSLALRVQNEPLLRDWAHDINVVTPTDMELVKALATVNNYHRPKDLVDMGLLNELVIEYQEPNMITDEADEYRLEQDMWKDGTSSPLLYVMRRNPEMDEDQAREYIKTNLAITQELTGLTFDNTPEEVQNHIDNMPIDEMPIV